MRNPIADEPGPGQESVWDYPRPPLLEPVTERLRVVLDGAVIADTTRGHRVLETSHPPVYYFPPEDILPGAVEPVPGSSFCEWKGVAVYFDVVGSAQRVGRGAWTYRSPTPGFRAIAGHVAFYAGPMDGCFVDEERVIPQPGGFYGGWITSRVVGPFKGQLGRLSSGG
ncbi:DUF427 domain-containing protein [Salinarimonas soli]|uniref:DUF427 domain-containing protein n=1 Tax=Salinarimonas soli TaxID=1638099 RepID=A0A5B2VYG7_9HYPH|nr:DUF427 domain-containing protein [Salinarimonas soli]KAA2244085.1 DUF427 domain-containing protein [Salinarimonas soli]